MSLSFSILIVEDDEDDRILIDDAFGEIGYEAEVKKFIAPKYLLEYLEKLERTDYPSLIVLDNSLPGMAAPDLIKTLKKDDRFKDIAIVVYSTLVTPQKNEELLHEGAFACFEKGITMKDLLNIAKQLRNIAENQKHSS